LEAREALVVKRRAFITLIGVAGRSRRVQQATMRVIGFLRNAA
jgi:hypothetical protein